MLTNIRDEIEQMTNIQLKQQDFIEQGLFANVYHYKIHNTELAIKCFQDQSKAEEENALLQKIQGLFPNCQYYGIKKLDIEIIGAFSEAYNGYAIFFQACLLDFGIFNKFEAKELFNFLSQMSLSLLCLHLNKCLYLADYREGNIFEELKQSDIKTLALKGTPFYFALELWYIFNKREQRFKCNPLATDIYSLGVIVLQLLVGIQAILKLNIARVNAQQYENELKNIKNILIQLPEFQQNSELLEIVLKMVNFEAEKRPKIREVCQTLINQKQFQMDALQNVNLQELVIQLIRFFNQPKPNIIQPALPNLLKSDILKNPIYLIMVLELFEKQSISFSRIHVQFNMIPQKFNAKAFHQDCDNKGSTLTIMHSNLEPNSFFGGMAVSSWNSDDNQISDPADECSWLFKIEVEESRIYLHQWKCIKKDKAIYGDQYYGPIFGEAYQALLLLHGKGYSELPTNNGSYKKVDLAEQLNNKTMSLFYQLRTQITCPQKVQREIMNETGKYFSLDSCEVFLINK